jgi:hypothetical protein
MPATRSAPGDVQHIPRLGWRRGDATKFPRELAELALAHKLGDDTEAAYRQSDALEKRRPMMEA